MLAGETNMYVTGRRWWCR